MAARPSGGRLPFIAIIGIYVPIHFALDVIVLNTFRVEGNAVTLVIVANVLIAAALAYGLRACSSGCDRATRPSGSTNDPRPELRSRRRARSSSLITGIRSMSEYAATATTGRGCSKGGHR